MHQDDATIGLLFIDSKAVCFTLEDEKRNVKLYGETRIPEGRYQIKLRKVESPLTLKYQSRFDWFKYHLELQNVKGFNYIYLHIGNYQHETDGCILLGMGAMLSKVSWISNSSWAFETVYKRVLSAIENGQIVTINICSI